MNINYIPTVTRNILVSQLTATNARMFNRIDVVYAAMVCCFKE